ncbi:HlyD family secretion protein [Pseudomonas aeruginosa]|nr:HlyD family secretion protein [Pseudomonas aeruginosa]
MKSLFFALVVVVLVLLFPGETISNWSVWITARGSQKTDNAYIRSDITRLTSMVSGYVGKVFVSDYQRVKKGDLLFQLDPRDYLVQVRQKEAALNSAVAQLENLKNQINMQHATIRKVKAQLDGYRAIERRANGDYARYKELEKYGAASKQLYSQSISDWRKSASDLSLGKASVVEQQRQLDVLVGQRKEFEANVKLAEADLKASNIQLDYTNIVAPFDGVVGQKLVQERDYVSVGTGMISIVPLPEVYVLANYKETQLANVRVGDRVEIRVDGLSGRLFYGVVDRISPASGSQFSLLPPDNATGNFTKVVQRIPVKIVFLSGQDQLNRLIPGMSVITTIQSNRHSEE